MAFRLRARSGTPAPGIHGVITGLDLGSTGIRAAVLEGARRSPAGAPSPVRLLAAVLPPGAVVEGVVHDPTAVTAALRHLAAENGLRGHRVVLGVGTPHLVVRPLTLPAMPADQLRRALPFQARDVLPIPVSDAVLDFSPLPRSGPESAPVAGSAGPGPSAGPVPGLLTAAPRAAVLAAVQAVQAAGLTVARVDLSPFGLLRSIGSAGPVVEALVDIGSDLTTIVIHRHGVPHLVRVIAFGGRRLTDRVADALGVPAAGAEAAKRAVGVLGDSMPALQLRDELRPLLAELRTSLHYFVGTVGSTVDRALLTGGTSRLPGLLDLLAAELGIGVQIGMPLRHLAVGAVVRADARPWGAGGAGTSRSGDEVGGGPASAVSVGLALGIPPGAARSGVAA